MIDTYIAFGGNFKDTLQTMRQAALMLQCMKGVKNFISSSIYQTSAVSPIPQEDYLNAVCRFQTTLSVRELWSNVQDIECTLGKVSKKKDQPRLIDLDLLFYGDLKMKTDDLILPHPRWNQRLFVLTPLADVTERVPTGLEVQKILEAFQNTHSEKIYTLKERLSHASSSCS
jgi:2-amino-4-hydroxy-6-hydroxymethyldihydropteridine diphosphokinase